jgi:hypothetical protein
MVRRGEITDRAWEHIEPLLPREGGKRGGHSGATIAPS